MLGQLPTKMYMVTVEETLPERSQAEGDGESSPGRRHSDGHPPELNAALQDTFQEDELTTAAAPAVTSLDAEEDSDAGNVWSNQPEDHCHIQSTQQLSSEPRNKTPSSEVDGDTGVTASCENKTETLSVGGEVVQVKDSCADEQQWEAEISPSSCPDWQESGRETPPTEHEDDKDVEPGCSTDVATAEDLDDSDPPVCEVVKRVPRSPSVQEEPSSPIWFRKQISVGKASEQEETEVDAWEFSHQEETCSSGTVHFQEKEHKSKETCAERAAKEQSSSSSPKAHVFFSEAEASTSSCGEISAAEAGGQNGIAGGEANHSSPSSSSENPPQSDSGSRVRGRPLQGTRSYTEYVTMPGISKQALDRQLSGWSVQSDQFEGTENQLLVYLRQGKSGLNQLKKLLRKNHWPTDHSIRHTLWVSLCRYLHKADGNLYDEMVKELFSPEDLEEGAEIPLPAFVDHNCLTNYHLSERGVALTTRVVAIINHMNPDITFSPTTYAVSCLFLHYMGASDCFNCVSALLNSKEQKFITQTKVAMEVSKLVVRDLAKKYVKRAYVFLVRQSSNIDSVFENWIWWIFKDLPFSHVVRVIDCFLLEGIKVLYRVALAILKLFAKHSGKKSREPDSVIVTNNISRFCERMPVDVSKLLKEAFGIRNFTRAEISRLEMKHEVYVKSRAVLGNTQDMPRVLSVQSMSAMSMSKAFSGPSFMAHAKSSILSPDMTHTLWGWLPVRFGVCQPYLLFTTEEHGTSLRTLYARVEYALQTLIIIKTTTGEVFGAFCSAPWCDRTSHGQNLSYFGTGETFIFTLRPEKMKYDWVGLLGSNIPTTGSMFLAGDNSVMTIGGGNGEAIKLDEDLNHCRSERSDTFMNEPLCPSGDFTCQVVEVFGFK